MLGAHCSTMILRSRALVVVRCQLVPGQLLVGCLQLEELD